MCSKAATYSMTICPRQCLSPGNGHPTSHEKNEAVISELLGSLVTLIWRHDGGVGDRETGGHCVTKENEEMFIAIAVTEFDYGQIA